MGGLCGVVQYRSATGTIAPLPRQQLRCNCAKTKLF